MVVIYHLLSRTCQTQSVPSLDYLVSSVSETTSELSVESQNFTIPRIFGAPDSGDPLEFHQDLWHQKTIVHGPLHDTVCMMIAILTVCDRQTDGQTLKHKATAHTA